MYLQINESEIYMKITSITWDLESIINKITRKQIILESDFQRGEVWPIEKKRKLIDTILRKWPIPPIILLESEKGDKFEILDGLQRITSIYQFVFESKFSIKGTIQPNDIQISELDKLYFKDIIMQASNNEFYSEILNSIYLTPISIYVIKDASTDEIAELFNRFNSPMTLTTVEKRNAHFGITRTQINTLLKFFLEKGANADTIGFANIRGTYEDILLKVCYIIETKKIDSKITPDILLEAYRNETEFSKKTIEDVEASIDILFSTLKSNLKKNQIKLSKASLFSVLVFISCVKVSTNRLNDIIGFISQVNKKGGSLKEIYDEYTFYASTDAKSIRVRQTILKLLSNEMLSFKHISEEVIYNKAQILELSERYNYIKDEYSK